MSGGGRFPRWVRAWHIANAILFLILLGTGLSLQYADPRLPWIPFRIARWIHNLAGILISVNWAAFALQNARTANGRQYRIEWPGLMAALIRQLRYYGYGIFLGAPHPFRETARVKFNPLQRLTYVLVMYGWFPAIAGTGWLLLFPDLAPARIAGWGGMWPMAVAHLVLAFVGTLFLIGHLYLATTGHRPADSFRAMVLGRDP